MPELSLLLLLTGLLGAYAAATTRRDRRRRLAAWRAIARRRRVQPPDKHEPLRLRIGDATVEVDEQKGMTEVRGLLPLRAGPVFALYPRHATMGVSVMQLARHPTVLAGIRRLDADFVLRTSEAELSRRLFTPRFATALAEQFPDAFILGERALLRLVVPKSLVDVPVIEAAIDLAAELANADLAGMAALRGLRGAEAGAGYRVQVEVGGTLVHYRPVADDGRASTRAWIDIADGPAFELELPPADLDGFLASLPAPPSSDALALLGRVGRARLAGTATTLELHFVEVERDGARLVAAGRLLRALASPASHGPYR